VCRRREGFPLVFFRPGRFPKMAYKTAFSREIFRTWKRLTKTAAAMAGADHLEFTIFKETGCGWENITKQRGAGHHPGFVGAQ